MPLDVSANVSILDLLSIFVIFSTKALYHDSFRYKSNNGSIRDDNVGVVSAGGDVTYRDPLGMTFGAGACAHVGHGNVGADEYVDKDGFTSGIRCNTKLASANMVVSPGGGLATGVGATVGLGIDTGATVRGGDNPAIGGKIAGTGLTIGRESEISFLGSSFRFRLW